MAAHEQCPECDALLPTNHVGVTDWEDEVVDCFQRAGRNGTRETVTICRRERTWRLYCEFCCLAVEAVEYFGRPGFAEVHHYHNRKDVNRIRRKIPGCARRGVA